MAGWGLLMPRGNDAPIGKQGVDVVIPILSTKGLVTVKVGPWRAEIVRTALPLRALAVP